jgi:hypothetical protein
MPRGPHPADEDLFAPPQHDVLRQAADDLTWLLQRGYAEASSLKLVGDRHALRQRQRTAVRRCVCTEAQRADRASRRVELAAVASRPLAIDGFNALIVLESILGGGVVLRGRDRAWRDMASVHGSYRRSEVTARALELLTTTLVEAAPSAVTWYLDRPVSNSGRLRETIEQLTPADLPWSVELPQDPDRVLVTLDAVVATADATILDAAGPWIDLPAAVADRHGLQPWLVDLS